MGCGAGPGGRSKQRRPRSQFALKRQPTLWWRAPRARPRVAACRPPARPSALGRVAHIVMCGPWGGQAVSWSVPPGLASRAMAPPPGVETKKNSARRQTESARAVSLCARLRPAPARRPHCEADAWCPRLLHGGGVRLAWPASVRPGWRLDKKSALARSPARAHAARAERSERTGGQETQWSLHGVVGSPPIPPLYPHICT